MTSAEFTVPKALHVGFSKCASTFLQAFFEEHPSIFLVNQSHYFSPFDIGKYSQGLDWYRSHYRNASADQVTLESDEHIIMPIFHPVLESAATTLESVDKVLDRIQETCGSPRIMMVVRNQAELIASRYSEYLLCGGKLNFAAFVEEQLSCSVDGRSYFENFYHEIARRIENRLGDNSLLLILQEDLKYHEAEVTHAMCEFLGVSHHTPSKRDMASRRVGLSVLGMNVVRPFNRLVVKQCKRSHQEAQVRIPFLLYKVMLRLFRYIDFYLPDSVKGSKSSLLTQELRKRIMQVFETDNRNLAKYLKKDLSVYGYYTD